MLRKKITIRVEKQLFAKVKEFSRRNKITLQKIFEIGLKQNLNNYYKERCLRVLQ